MVAYKYEPCETLQTAASRAGHPVSLVMLKKWRAAGLLPRPLQRSRGRGRGTETLYPAGSTGQLLRLLEIRAEGGRFDPEQALWRLWWEGWPVEPERVRALLGEALSGWERNLAVFADDDGDMADAFGVCRLPPMLARARKRVGGDAMPTVAALILSALAGEAPKDWQDGLDASTLLRGLGLDQMVRALSPDSQKFTSDLAGTLHRFGFVVSPKALRDALDKAGDAELATARDDLRSLVGAVQAVWNVVARLVPKSNAGRDMLDQPTAEAMAMLPAATLIVLGLRRDTSYRDVLDSLRPADKVIAGLITAMARENQTGQKMPPRRLAPSGSVAHGEETSTCTPSLSPPQKSSFHEAASLF